MDERGSVLGNDDDAWRSQVNAQEIARMGRVQRHADPSVVTTLKKPRIRARCPHCTGAEVRRNTE